MTTLTVVLPGPMTTVQDWPGRLGHWDVGVPPSGPMDELGHRIVVAGPFLAIGWLIVGFEPIDHALDGLVGGAAHLGCGAIASEFSVSRNDVHTVLRRLQWNSRAVMVIGWHLHRHRLGLEFRVDTTNTGWGLLSGHQRGPRPGHQWGLFHGHGHTDAEVLAPQSVRDAIHARADALTTRYRRDLMQGDS